MTLLGALAGAGVAVALALPLAWKWQLGVLRVAVAVVLLAVPAVLLALGLDALAGLGPAGAGALAGAVTVALSLGVLAWRFYRDPERTPPRDSGAVVSPADGEVVYVRRAADGVLPVAEKAGREHRLDELTGSELGVRDAHVIGIAMSFLDVHVNRAPIEGTVTLRRHVPGLFGSLRDPEMLFQNERATTVIENGRLQVAVVQIASRLVRQIASFVDEGQHVEVGQRIGVIRLGSQVDVVLPALPGVEVSVRPGERVRAGESVLARLGEADGDD